ncbi:MAG: hypothetical protein U0703_11655 [Anaerolineae bacterium]
MTAEHERWLAQAVEFARVKRYDEAREYALRVIREDGRNPRALWIVASSTGSLTERRNALKALLRVQPDNLHAQKMLDSLEREITAKGLKVVTGEVRAAQPTSTPQPVLLYAAVAVAAVVIVALVVVAAGIL